MLTKNGQSWISPTSQVVLHCWAYLFFSVQRKNTIPVLSCDFRKPEKISYICSPSVNGQTYATRIPGYSVPEAGRSKLPLLKPYLNSWTTCSNFTPIVGRGGDKRESSTTSVFVHFIAPAYPRCCKKECCISPDSD